MLINLLLTLIVLGVALFLVQQIPMDAKIALIIRVVVIIIAVFLVLSALGVVHGLPRL